MLFFNWSVCLSQFLSDDEMSARAEARENALMDRVDWRNLSLAQKDLINTRRTLLKYSHRLDSYLDIVKVHAGQLLNLAPCS